MASHPGCWAGPAPSLARLAHGVERLVRDAGWGGGSAQAETRPPAVKAPESEPLFSLPTPAGPRTPACFRSPRSRASGCAEEHVAICVTVRGRAGAPRRRGREPAPEGHAATLTPSSSSRSVDKQVGVPGPAQLTVRCAA